MRKPAELRELDGDSLEARARELDDELFRMRIQMSLGQLEAPSRIRAARRERAQVLTILKEKAK